jgi:hypothetical protein
MDTCTPNSDLPPLRYVPNDIERVWPIEQQAIRQGDHQKNTGVPPSLMGKKWELHIGLSLFHRKMYLPFHQLVIDHSLT